MSEYNYEIRAYSAYRDVDINTMYNIIDRAIEGNRGITLLTHDISDNPSSYGYTEENFELLVSYIAEKRDAGLITPVTIDGLYRAFQGIETLPISGSTLYGKTTGLTEIESATNVGFVWGNTRLNNPEGLTPENSGYTSYWISDNGNYASQTFTHIITKPSGKFYYRSAANVNGTWVYGEELTYSPYINYPYYHDGVSYKANNDGYNYDYSDQPGITDTQIPLEIIPLINSVNVTVSTWSNTQKVWTLSSETQQSVTHTIGGFPANTDIDIYRDGIDYATVRSNSTGYITWVYDGGFSEHTFEAIVSSETQVTVNNPGEVSVNSNVITTSETQYINDLYNNVTSTITSGYTLAGLMLIALAGGLVLRYLGYI